MLDLNSARNSLEAFKAVPLSSKASYFFVGYAIYFILRSIYRVYFHPLSHIPGPFLAKITPFYEFYYEVILKGQAINHAINDLYPKYGSVVRTQPDRVRVLDPEGWHQVHHVGFNIHRDMRLWKALNLTGSIFSINDPTEFKARRQLLKDAFLKANAYNIEKIVQRKVANLCETLKGTAKAKARVTLTQVTYSVCVDISCEFTAGHVTDAAKNPNLNHPLSEFIRTVEFPLVQFYFPNFIYAVQQVPQAITVFLFPHLTAGLETRKILMGRVYEYQSEQTGAKIDSDEKLLSTVEDGVKDNLVVASSLLSSYPNAETLSNEVFALFSAGTGAPAWPLAATLYDVSVNQDVESRLLAELREAFPDKNQPLDLATLERLPYLTAVLKEGLRMHPPTVGTLPRVSVKDNFAINGIPIPKGTGIDTSVRSVLENPEVFPQPDKFIPSRWLPESPLHNTTKIPRLDRYLVSFGSGTRLCLGMHLGWLELYVVLGTLLRRFEFIVCEKAREEGWLYEDRWLACKSGDEGWANVVERAD